MNPLSAARPLFVEPELEPAAKAVFVALARCRFLRVDSVMAFAGPLGLSTELLDAWIAAGFLHVGTVRMDPLRPEETRYLALTSAGARALSFTTAATFLGISPARLRRSSQKRAHDLVVGEVLLAALALAHDQRIELLGVEADDRKLCTSILWTDRGGTATRVALRPDAYILAQGERGSAGLLVEVDRGTITPKTMGARYAGYLTWLRSGGPERDFHLKALRVLTVAPTLSRLAALQRVALEANGGRRSGFFLFARESEITIENAERLLGPVALPLGSTDKVSLFDARCGKSPADQLSSSVSSIASTHARSDGAETTRPATQSG